MNIPASISRSDQLCFNVVDQTKSDIRFSNLQNVDTTLESDVETTLKQRCTKSFELCFDIDTAVFQLCFNLVSTLVFETSLGSNKYGFVDSLIFEKLLIG